MGKASKMVRCWGKQKAVERKKKENVLRQAVHCAQKELEVNIGSTSVQEELRVALEALQEFKEEHVKWVESITQETFLKDGDRCSKVYFKTFRGLASATEIHSIYNNARVLQTEWLGIAQAAIEHFQNRMGKTQGVNRQQLDEVLLAQLDQITELEKEVMEVPIEANELLEAARALGRNRCPGEDGAPVEFFINNWKTVGASLHRAALQGITEGNFHKKFTKGYIVLLCKAGD
jgi:hypothetical protein